MNSFGVVRLTQTCLSKYRLLIGGTQCYCSRASNYGTKTTNKDDNAGNGDIGDVSLKPSVTSRLPRITRPGGVINTPRFAYANKLRQQADETDDISIATRDKRYLSREQDIEGDLMDIGRLDQGAYQRIKIERKKREYDDPMEIEKRDPNAYKRNKLEKMKRDHKSHTSNKIGVEIAIHGEILFGLHPVLMALEQSRRHFYHLHHKKTTLTSHNALVQRIFELCKEKGVDMTAHSTFGMEMISKRRPHQGVCLDCSKYECDFIDQQSQSKLFTQIDNSPRLWLIIDSVQDPMNFGAVLRSCHYLGVERVFVLDTEQCPPTPVVSKASAGVMECANIHSVQSYLPLIQAASSRGWTVYGTVGRDHPKHTALQRVQMTSNSIVIIGNEGRGLSEDILNTCDHLLCIPPCDAVNQHLDSLNVSVATGIILHHLRSSVI